MTERRGDSSVVYRQVDWTCWFSQICQGIPMKEEGKGETSKTTSKLNEYNYE